MAVRPRTLSLENLESRLNLSGLGGLATVTKVTPPMTKAQETSRLTNTPRVTSLTDYSRVVLYTNLNGSKASTSFGTGMTAPANLSTTHTGSAIKLKWTDKSGNEAGFRVYRSTDGTNFQLIGTVARSKTTFTDLTAVAGVEYTYGIASFDADSQSALSNLSSHTLPVSAPAAPTGTEASSVTANSVSISWFDEAKNEAGYHVYRSDDGESYKLVGDLTADSTSFTDTGLHSGTSYSYEVSSWSAGGETYAMSAVSVVTQAPPTQGSPQLAPVVPMNTPTTAQPAPSIIAGQAIVPSSPTQVTVLRGSASTLQVNWTDNSNNEGGFNVYRSTDGVNFSKVGFTWANNCYFTDVNLAQNQTYIYKVSAWSSDGEAFSAPGFGTTATNSVTLHVGNSWVQTPNTPTGLFFSNVNASSLSLAWQDPNTNQKGFSVYRSTDGINYSKIADVGANTTSYSDAGLSSGTNYYYRIAAFNDAGQTFSSSSKQQTTGTPALQILQSAPVVVTPAAPVAPAQLTVTGPTLTSLTLNWTDSSTDETGFRVYRSTDGTNYTLVTSLSANVTSFVDSGLSSTTVYNYKISAWNSGGETLSSAAGGTTLTPVVAPNAPASVTFAGITTSALTLNWADAATNETGYRVYRSTDGVNYTKIVDLAANTTSYADSNLTNNTTYFYKVSAWNSAAETSVTASQKTSQSAPSAPAQLGVSNPTTSSLQLSWTDTSTNETGFRIYRSTDGANFTLIGTATAGSSSFTDAGLSGGTTYTYKVAAWNAGGETSSTTAAGTTQALVVAPSAPASVTFANVTTSSLALNWSDLAANETGYRVYRSTDGANFTKVADLAANATTFTDAGLSNNTTYVYRIAAWNSAGETTTSAISQKTLQSAPTLPGSLTISNPTISSLQIAWSDTSNNESGFHVYRSTDGSTFTLVGDLSAGVTTFSDTGLSSSTTYTYKVAAWNAGGETTTAAASATTQALVMAPTAPASVTFANISTTALTINWSDAATNESGYRVYRSTDGASFSKVADLGANSTTFADSGLSSGTTYCYKIAAWNSAAEITSSPASEQTAIAAPNSPAALTVSNPTTSTLQLAWSDTSTNETGFNIYRSTDGTNYTLVTSLSANTTSFTDTGLASNTSYSYKISAFNAAAEVTSSAATGTTQILVVAPAAPASVTFANITTSSLTLNWSDAATNESGYRVYRSTDGTNFSKVADLGANTTTYADSGLASSTTYYYKIAAWNSAAEIATSAVTQQTAIAAPSVPSALSVNNPTTTSLQLSWSDNSSNETGFKLYRSTDGTNFTLIGNLSANTTSFTDTGLNSSTTYSYKVSAWNSAGEITSSAVNGLTQTLVVAPNAPANVTFASVTTTGLTINWADMAANETGYRVYRSTDGTNFSKVADLGANTTTFSDSGLSSNATYYYKIAAWNSAAETTAAGSQKTAVAAPGAPTWLTVAYPTSSALQLFWIDNASNETGFHVYRSTDGTNFSFIGDAAANATTFTDTGLNPSTTYTYRVSAFNSGGEAMGWTSTGTTLVALPTAPSSTSFASVTSSSLTVKWADNSANETGYRVYRSTDGVNFTWLSDLAANTTSFNDTSLAANTSYTYKIAAWNAAGEVSTLATQKTLVSAPAAPTWLTVAYPTSTSLQLYWLDNSTNETGFHVYRSTDGANFTLIGDAAANATFYADSSLVPGTTYTYKVSSFNAGGVTDGWLATGTTQVALPAAPSATSFANITSNSMTINWTDNSANESGFRVYRSVDGVNYNKVADLAANAKSFADTNLFASTTYYYKIASFNSAGEVTATVATQTTTAQPPSAPTAVSFPSSTATAITLAWTDTSTNETGYRVYRSTDGTNFSKIADLAAGATTYADSGLSAGTTYYYKIAAWNSAGETQGTVNSKTTQAAAPAAPTSVNFTAITSGSLSVNWSDTSVNESGYRVYRSVDGVNFSLVADLAAGTTTFADAGLAGSTTYYYKVAAWNSGGETLTSASSATTLVAAQTVINNGVTITTRNMTSFTELVIDGTSSNDSILVTQSNGILTITANGQSQTVANTFGDIMIYGEAGNDNITVDSSLNIAVLIYGGDGNNTIKNQTRGKATIVTINSGVNTVTGNGINTAFWVNTGDTVNATGAEIALGGVNKIASFYQPFTTDPTNAKYVPRSLNGQNLADPTDAGQTKRLTNSSLWGTGPTMNDIVQTGLADCYFLAPLASLAYSEPQKLMNTAVDLGDGTYAFRFTRYGVTSYVRVDGDLSVGGWSYGLANATPGANGNQWGGLFEKAYAFFRTGANTFASLNYGFQTASLMDLGFTANNILASSGATTILNTINTQLNAGHAMASNTNYSITGGAPLIAAHVYSVIGAYLDTATNTVMVKLRNPWGSDGAGNDGANDGLVTITYDQFAANFSLLTYATS